MSNQPFGFFPLPAGRSSEKPRNRGLTMVMDWGMPLSYQDDWLRMHARFVDLMKIVVGTARLYDEECLRQKLEVYRRHQVRPFIGGMFLEYVLHDQGMASVARYCREAQRLGVEMVEVSDNLVPFTANERDEIIRIARDHGLKVVGEVGSKFSDSSGEDLARQVTGCLEAGTELVLIEGAELLKDGAPNEPLCKAIKHHLDLDRVMFELGGPWIPGTTVWSTFALRLFLIQFFGPDVNLANVMPDLLLDTEATRVGLGDPLEDPDAMAGRSALRADSIA